MSEKNTLLTTAETELIASLTESPAYKALLKVVDAEISRLGDILAIANPLETPSILAVWRSMRRIYQIFAVFPEQCQHTLEQFESAPFPGDPTQDEQEIYDTQKLWTERLQNAHIELSSKKVQ